jgi:peptidoglycan/LPS O-acetylase OafA/YrhL
MNLEELMSVWQSQVTSPLHEMDKTLLHRAVQQDQAKFQMERRAERCGVYVACAAMVAAMAFFIAIMFGARDRNGLTGWDYAVAIGGLIAAVLLACATYVNNKRELRSERVYSDSLRDQLKRRIAQLDDDTTKFRWTLALTFLAGICPIAILVLSWRINGKPFSDAGYMFVWLILLSCYAVVAGFGEIRRQAKDRLPQKHRLEELLKEVDDA